MKTRPNLHRRPRFALILGTLAVASALALSGCYESATDPSGSVTTDAVADLTLDEVMAKVQLSNEQAAALAPVLDAWRQQQRSGNRNQLGALRMLADASDVLDHSQMVALLGLMEEKHQVAMQNRMQNRQQNTNRCGPGQCPGQGPGQGPGPMGDPNHLGPNGAPLGPGGDHGRQGPRDGRGGPGMGLLQELGLDETQQAAIQAARDEMHAAAQTLFEQFRAGTLTREELHAAMQPLREQMWTTIEGILTAEQLAQLNELRNARVLAQLEKALERIQANLTEKLPLIAQILGLDEQQLAAATSLHEERITALTAIIESLRSGQMSGQEAREAAQALREQTLADFRALLTAEQQEIFDALKMLQHRGHRRGPGR